jgi:hypothetical protein
LGLVVLESVGNWDMKQNNESTNTEIYGAEKKERIPDSNTVVMVMAAICRSQYVN